MSLCPIGMWGSGGGPPCPTGVKDPHRSGVAAPCPRHMHLRLFQPILPPVWFGFEASTCECWERTLGTAGVTRDTGNEHRLEPCVSHNKHLAEPTCVWEQPVQRSRGCLHWCQQDTGAGRLFLHQLCVILVPLNMKTLPWNARGGSREGLTL